MPLLLAGCAGQQETPVDWWHDLQGGAIAEHRPPPPGADLPYPNINTVPPKPVLPSESYRRTVAANLIAERDDAQRIAARNPIIVEPPPPPPPAAPANPAANPAAETANATIPAAEASPTKPTPAPPPQPGPTLRLAGAGVDEPNLPPIPDAPPAPPSFESVAAQPAPTPPPPLPASTRAAGTQILFATGSAVLDSSQHPAVNSVSGFGRHGKISVEGHGDAANDSPEGQEIALKLALERAQAIAKQLSIDGVQPDAIILSATAFGRGATVRGMP